MEPGRLGVCLKYQACFVQKTNQPNQTLAVGMPYPSDAGDLACYFRYSPEYLSIAEGQSGRNLPCTFLASDLHNNLFPAVCRVGCLLFKRYFLTRVGKTVPAMQQYFIFHQSNSSSSNRPLLLLETNLYPNAKALYSLIS